MKIAVVVPQNFEAARALRDATSAELAVVHDEAGLRAAIGDADVVVLHPRYGDRLRGALPYAKRLRWIHSLGAGVETLPFDLLRATSITVTNSRGIYGDALAEFVVGAMLWFAKDFRRLMRNQQARIWKPFDVEWLQGKTAGIIGHGGIGRAVSSRAEALGMNVITNRRTGGEPLEVLVPQSDYVVVSTPLTSETRGLMNAGHIAAMRRSAVLINVSRGAVVDEAALVEALRHNRIRGAALDVFEVEPLPPESPLWDLDNVLLSPHSADHTTDSHERAMRFFLSNLERYEKGQPLANTVDFATGY